MTAVPLPEQRTTHSPFSEVREAHRQATLAVIATSAVAASSCLIATILIALGVTA